MFARKPVLIVGHCNVIHSINQSERNKNKARFKTRCIKSGFISIFSEIHPQVDFDPSFCACLSVCRTLEIVLDLSHVSMSSTHWSKNSSPGSDSEYRSGLTYQAHCAAADRFVV